MGSLVRMVKGWCADVGLRGNYDSHILRKTWGYHQLRINKAPIPLLMDAYGYAIQSEEIQELYDLEL